MRASGFKVLQFIINVRKAWCILCICLSAAGHAQTDRAIIDFTHRLLDTLSVQTEGEGKDFLSRKHITLSMNGFPVTQLTTLKATLRNVTGYQINRNEGIFCVEMNTKENSLLRMTFPADRELIQGTDKPTADSLLFLCIKDMANCDMPPRERMYVPEAMNNGLYLHRGNWFTTAKLRNDAYLTLHNGVFQPVYSKAYPEESLLNLLLGLTKNNVRLKVRHHQYANHIATAEAPLNSIIDVLREGCELYVAHETTRGRDMGYAFFYCEALNYLHVLTIQLPKEFLTESTIVLPADLRTYIPQHNIKNLNKKYK